MLVCQIRVLAVGHLPRPFLGFRPDSSHQSQTWVSYSSYLKLKLNLVWSIFTITNYTVIKNTTYVNFNDHSFTTNIRLWRRLRLGYTELVSNEHQVKTYFVLTNLVISTSVMTNKTFSPKLLFGHKSTR